MITCLALAAAMVVADDPPPKVVPRRVEVLSPIEGEVTILKLLPAGSRVRKGDTICELNPSPLRDRLQEQEVAVLQARAAFEAAGRSVKLAELAAREEKFAIDSELQSAQATLALCVSDRNRAQDRAEWSKKRAQQGALTPAQARVDQVALLKAKFDVEQAQTQLDVLKRFTQPRRAHEAEGAVARAGGEERLAKARFERERDRAEELARQIQRCVLLAPADGKLRRAEPGAGRPAIEEGTNVRERQLLFVIEAD